MVTCSFMAGSAPRPVELTTIVLSPVPGMSNFMVSAPGLELASSMADLSEHEPPNPQKPLLVMVSWKSAVEFTVKVVEAWAGWAASMRHAANSAATTIRHAPSAFVLHAVPLVLLSMAWFICLSFLSFRGGREALSGFLCPEVTLERARGHRIVRGTYLGVPVS